MNFPHLTECSRTPYRTFMNTIERTRPLFMFVHLTNRTKFLVRVRSFLKRTNINELPAERFTNCSLNVRFVYSPNHGSIQEQHSCSNPHLIRGKSAKINPEYWKL
ncbi:hypothetical protein HanXRQr2_Chr15g0716461 [Helianthus annuus]|uniref:Uncharacterized protein n=1 Tax=Helianthus annuus TaxID=4232 RepID=A0A9K3E3Z8_HELAN|nr:hypothetical protein HanXRQr2_Chr15g0716461 [Helianthus annuus]KAJ0833192.1 hypothetical protein HanPSC8_Chr15g0687441 [Helianthus annuus]